MPIERKYLFRHLPHHLILRVVSQRGRGRRAEMSMMRQVSPLQMDAMIRVHGEFPSGFWCESGNGVDGVILPKRRRGEKFLVQFTEVRERVL